MRWSDIKKAKEPKYQHGQLRTVRRFLLFPKKIGHETRWLEIATWIQEFHVTEKEWTVFGDYNKTVNKWRDSQWSD